MNNEINDYDQQVIVKKKNTTLNGVSTFTIKATIKTLIFGLKGLLKVIESYERGEITEEQCLGKGEEIAKNIDAEFNKPGFKALELDEQKG